MSTVITVPASLDDTTFETMLHDVAALPDDAKLVIDARHARFASPYGLIGMLTLAQSRTVAPEFIPPEDLNTASYWARAGFFEHAKELMEIRGTAPKSRKTGDSSSLLDVTRIARTEDVQFVVSHIQERSKVIMETLGFPAQSSMGFSVVLSESCQNIIEHAGGPGWVSVQAYDWQKRLGRRVVMIAVSDSGTGFRKSLEHRHPRSPGERWDDGAALESAVLRATSRFNDPGRGQGLAGIRRYMGKWDGKLTVRSGTARIGMIPTWAEPEPALVENLPHFAGAQYLMIIPQALPT